MAVVAAAIEPLDQWLFRRVWREGFSPRSPFESLAIFLAFASRPDSSSASCVRKRAILQKRPFWTPFPLDQSQLAAAVALAPLSREQKLKTFDPPNSEGSFQLVLVLVAAVVADKKVGAERMDYCPNRRSQEQIA